MIRGIYTAASGMVSQEIYNEVRTNNIANIDTVGFKEDTPTFKSFFPYEIYRSNKKEFSPIGKLNMGAELDKIYTNFNMGIIRETKNPLDLAIGGDGFFVISTKGGELYTRAGNFTLSSNGELVTPDGLKVQGRNGNIVIDGENVNIGEDGSVVVDGEEIDKIKIVNFKDKNLLKKMGNNMFKYVGKNNPVTPKEYTVKQGFLEYPNVNIVKEMVSLLEASRAYETNQKVFKLQDESLSRAITELGRVG